NAAGSAIVTIIAFDANMNIATGYRGTVHFSSDDATLVLPADYTFLAADNGVHEFQFTVDTPRTVTINAADTSTPVRNGSVILHGRTTLSLTAAPEVDAGVRATVTITAYDGNMNVATGYTGTVHFTTDDASVALPANYTFVAADGGVHTFQFTVSTPRNVTITATDISITTRTGSVVLHARADTTTA